MKPAAGFVRLSLAITLASAAASAGAAFWLTQIYYRGEIARIEARERQAQDEANAQAHAAAASFEAWRAAQKPKVITVIREVDRVIEVERAWSSAPLPDGVRDVIDAAHNDFTQPDRAVPAGGGIKTGDQRGFAAGLRVEP